MRVTISPDIIRVKLPIDIIRKMKSIRMKRK